jgi:hypothetical protein
MIARILIIPAVLLTLAASAPARADELSETERLRVLDGAVVAFDRGAAETSPARAAEHYRLAADGFEKLLAGGVENGELYYNLGNTYLRLGDVGRAIANYRRAARFIPDDANLNANLRFARSRVQTPIEPSAENKLLHGVLFWHYGTSARGRTQVAIVCFVACWLLLSIRLATNGAWLRNVAIALLIVAVVAGASSAASVAEAGRTPDGVLVAGSTVIRKGNGITYEPVFNEPLSAGVEFTILETRTDATGRVWHRVVFPNDAQGWLPADASIAI